MGMLSNGSYIHLRGHIRIDLFNTIFACMFNSFDTLLTKCLNFVRLLLLRISSPGLTEDKRICIFLDYLTSLMT